MFKTNFSGNNKIGEHCPRMPVNQKFCTWLKILLHYVFG